MSTRIFSLITGRAATAANHGLTFSLKELLPDEGGEVVIQNQTGTDVTVLTDDPVIDRGIERDHITSGGDDVSGFAYCRFAGGITVFYPRSQSLCIKEGESV
ncbi:MAG: hypothetical protein WB420_11165 [Bradyrhizobium sp.]